MTILLVGAGGVASVIAHKCAQNNRELGDLIIASRTIEKCQKIIDSIRRKNNLADPNRKLEARQVNANHVDELVALIAEVQPHLVINAGPPWVNHDIMEACVRAKVHYLDTSVATDLCSEGQQVPQAYDGQWAFRQRFADANISGLLSFGFDPGVVSVFCAYAAKHLFDTIDTIDVLDVNGGNHGRKFATNFDPETNLLEIQGDSFYWENQQWQRVPCHTRSRRYTFPEVGEFTLYSMAHDEIRSLVEFIPAKRIEFWMGFGENYLKYFNVLRDLGLLSPEPVTTAEGVTVAPIKVVKALLPDPTSLAANYTGKTCIGCLIEGEKDGKRRKVFIYNLCDHKAAFEEVESQAISYTTGVPAVTAALLLTRGIWQISGVQNPEQFDPDPFMELMPKIGLTWEVQELDPALADPPIETKADA